MQLILDKNCIYGYELRDGNTVRNASNAPIKTYSRSKIAKGMSLRAENPIRKQYPLKSTLVRKPLINIIESGV